MNSFEAAARVAARKWSQTSNSTWAVAAGMLLIAIGLIAGFADHFAGKGAVVMICIGVFVTAVALVVKSIRGARSNGS